MGLARADMTEMPSSPPPFPPPPGPSPSDLPTLSTPEPAPRRSLRIFVAVGAVLALLVAGGGAAACLRLRGAPEELLGELPASTDLVVVAYLDPAASQKLNLLRLQSRFPSLASSQHLREQVDAALDSALRGSGLDHDDLDWVGSEVALAVDIPASGEPRFAILLTADDTGAAGATLRKLRDGPASGPSTWSSRIHGGVQVWTGSDASGSDQAMSIIDRTVVVSNSASMIDGVIDANDGTVARLQDDTTFRTAMSDLPKAKLGFLYLNAASLVDRLEMGSAEQTSVNSDPILGELNATTSVAVSVSAEPDGLAIDTARRYDRSKLSPDMLDRLSQPDRPNPLLADVPADAYGVVAEQHVDTTVRSLMDQLATRSPEAGRSLEAAGIDDLIRALSGDLVMEFGPGDTSTSGPASVPGGALMLGSSNDAVTASELDQLAAAVSSWSGERWRTERHKGVTIHVLSGGARGLPITPAYAMIDHAAVVATSAEEMERVVDTTRGGPNIMTSPVFSSAIKGSGTPEGLVFVDVQRVVGGVRAALPPVEQALFDRIVAPDLRNVLWLFYRSKGDVSGSRSRVFLRVR
jgi:hypothetical protein